MSKQHSKIEYNEYGCGIDANGEVLDDVYEETDKAGNLLDQRLLGDYITVANNYWAKEASEKIGVPYATYLLFVLRTALEKAEDDALTEPLPTKEIVIKETVITTTR